MNPPGLRSSTHDHHERAARPPATSSALTVGVGSRLLVAAGAALVLWLFVAWAIA
jgi:hypothetical protein